MSTARYTGGVDAEWEATEDGLLIHHTSCPVADVYGRDDAERLANARLMAAAPEMLRALRRLLDGPGLSDQEIQRVIAKATGDES